MPEGFKDIHLGMAVEDFKQIRRSVVPDDVIDGGRDWPNGYARLISLDENAKNPFFSNAKYTFDNGRLSGIYWQAFVPKETLQNTLKEFLPSVLKLYGHPSLLKSRTDGGPKHAIVIIWRKQKTLVYAQITPEASFYRLSANSARADRGYVLISIKAVKPTESEAFINNHDVSPPSNKDQVNRYLVLMQKEILKLLPNTKAVPIAASSKDHT